MPVFLTLNDSNIFDPAFWGAQDVQDNSTIDATGVSDDIQIILTGSSITFNDTSLSPPAPVTFTDDDLGGGSYSNFVAFEGNDADNIVGGSVGLDSSGYEGGSGDDQFTDDGVDGGQLDGGGGDDTLTGGIGDNQITGGSGNDLLTGGGGNNDLSGGGGSDTLIGGEGSGTLVGGGGADLFVPSELTTFVSGGGGDDSMLIPDNATFAPFFDGSTSGLVTVTLEDGSTNSFVYLSIAADNISVICFAAGTRIATPHGPVRVETLGVGDAVLTYSDGAQNLKWIGHRMVSAQGRFAPICFKRGSIGNSRDLYVSPQHRVLLSGWRCEMLFGEPEVLCAAKHLVDGDQIYRAPRPWISYYHLMFDRHQIVFANDAPAESLFIGEAQMREDPDLYEELLTLFPELSDPDHANRQIAVKPLRQHEAAAWRHDRKRMRG